MTRCSNLQNSPNILLARGYAKGIELKAELYPSANPPDVVFLRAVKLTNALLLLGVLIAACATATVSPGVTFLAGLNNYQGEMELLEARPERWPDRQRLAESIKMIQLATLGGSKEFNRLVDLDLRRREFLITLRTESVSSQRAKEMREELVQINEQMEGLKKVVKGQIARVELRAPSEGQGIENIATIGLLNLAIDAFAVTGPPNVPAPMSTRVGSYVVTNQGSFSTVQTPDGQNFRCTTSFVPDGAASIRCAPVGGKS